MTSTNRQVFEERLKEKAQDWGLTEDSIAETLDLMEADGVLEEALSDEALFLYGKLVRKYMGSLGRKDDFNRLLNPNELSMEQARERLTRIVTTGETSPRRLTLDRAFFFGEFIQNHGEWEKSKDVFVLFRDHPKLQGKPHAHVERYQPSGLCYMHAPIVMQHYLVAMNTRDPTPMLNMIKYIRQHMSPENLYSHIWANKGSSSVEFLIGILAPSEYVGVKLASRAPLESKYLAQCMLDFGPGLVSYFKVRPEFSQVDRWSHTGKATGQVRGRHAMLLVGHRKVNGESRFLLQNWWENKPYVEVDLSYLISSGCSISFVMTPQTRMPDLPTNTESIVECDVDASEEFMSEG